jgi:two-component system response regulator FlrC
VRTDGDLNAHECKALWLDPFQPAGDRERTCLAEAGLTLLVVRTLDDLRHALKSAQVVVVRLRNDASLLVEVQRLIQAFKSSIPVICRTNREAFDLGIEAMQAGACHVLAHDDYSRESWKLTRAYVAKAQSHESAQSNDLKADQQARNAATEAGQEAVSPSRSSTSCPSDAGASAKPPARTFVFVDPTSQRLLALAQRVGAAEVTTLITGPTGSGKEVLATVIHESSGRCKGPFVSLNCGAIPEHLMEDMLFGHDKGAYTGAIRDHKGVFEQAQGGTVFLDEIGELPLNLQSKLLRVLQERKVTRLGGSQAIDLDFRLVAATNKDLKEAMQDRSFREDLYFRISTFRLAIPRLSQRPADILPLVAQILTRFCRADDIKRLSLAAQQALLTYSWPGNVRELENVIQRALVFCAGDEIDMDHLVFDDLGSHDSNCWAQGHGWTDIQVDARPLLPAASESSVSLGSKEVREFVGPPTREEWMAVGSQDPHLSSNGHVGTELSSRQVACSEFVGPMQPAPSLHVGPHASDAPIRLPDLVKTNERQVILAALESAPTKAEAARRLGISPRTLRYKMAQLRMAGAA